jgi:glycosyltransferase involved in cell wall biosynthesis
MKIVFFTLYFPPDIGAGSFRAISLVNELSKKIHVNSQIHVITSHPNRYITHRIQAKDNEQMDNVFIHRIKIPSYGRGMLSQTRTFIVYAIKAFKLSLNIKPNFILGTTSRLMTGVLTYISARYHKCNYFIDLRDIFSETISDIFRAKNRFFAYFIKYIFILIERKILDSASGVNVVSEGFTQYFESININTSNWYFFPNGVDDEFVNLNLVKTNNNKTVKTILYAGNIGNGQGLEKIIPDIAMRLGPDYKFVIIGDGGAINLLERKIKKCNIVNIELIPPVSRIELIEHYNNADILFLHLNNIKALERVLPSKIFEYAAIGRPIIAGLNGYSADFLRRNIDYSQIFEPGDINTAVSYILSVDYSSISDGKIHKFIKKYSRKSIMSQMANELTLIIEEKH